MTKINKKTQQKVYVNKSSRKTTRKRKKVVSSYSKEQLQEALNALEKHSFREVSNQFSIPIGTLHRRKKFPQRKKKGPAPYLTSEEEDEIAQWIIHRAKIGCPATKNELFDHVQEYLQKINRPNKFKDNKPARAWFDAFKVRHPEITIRKAQALEACRESVTEEDLRGWFKDVKTYLESKNLIDIDPSRVWNCDETSLQLNPKPRQVLAEKGAATVYQTIDGSDKENYSVLFMYAADGTRAPPIILYKAKSRVPNKVVQKLPQGWSIGLSENGFMQRENFYEYITNIWYPFLLKLKVQFPVVLFTDGHISHITIPLVSFCRQKSIEIVILYPHSTHITQPLDIAYFAPLKGEVWRDGVRLWKLKTGKRGLKKEDFAPVLKSVIDAWSNEKQVIINGFKASGLYPLNPDIVEYDVLCKKKKKKHDATENCDNVQNESDKIQSTAQVDTLQTLEKYIPADILVKFKSTTFWSSDCEYKKLFDVWFKLKNDLASKLNPGM